MATKQSATGSSCSNLPLSSHRAFVSPLARSSQPGPGSSIAIHYDRLYEMWTTKLRLRPCCRRSVVGAK